MPTTYTDCLDDEVTFNDFVLLCARAFLPNMRDAGPTQSLYYGLDLEDYSADLNNSRIELERLKSLTNDQRITYGQELKDKQIQTEQEIINSIINLKNCYNNMLEKVAVWQPYISYMQLKRFMLEQIDQSMTHDCGHLDHAIAGINVLENKKPLEYYEESVDFLKRDIMYYEKYIEDHQVQREKTIEWIDGLYSELNINSLDIKPK